MSKTILLVDDSVTIRKVVELTFSDTDIHVETAGSGREALEKLPRLDPDLVLADIVMPEPAGPAGYEICRTVKASAKPVPVLLLAGTFEHFDAQLADECGADGHISKPFESEALVRRVEDLLARQPVPEPEPDPEPDPETMRSAPAATAPDTEPRAEELEEVLEELAEDDDVERPTDGLPLTVEHRDEQAAPIAVSHEAAPASAPQETVEVEPPAGLSDTQLDALADAVAARLSTRVLERVAWDVVPELAERLIRNRLREIEEE